MKISEQPVEDDLLENIRGCARDAAAMLELQVETKAPAEVVAAVDECVRQLQRGQGPEMDDEDDPALMLGSLWGEQLVRQFGWQWAGVTFHDHDDSTAVGVFSPDRALAIYPLHFVHGCLENDATVAITLSFNMLLDGGRIPQLPAGGYENVMDNVQHIVPPS